MAFDRAEEVSVPVGSAPWLWLCVLPESPPAAVGKALSRRDLDAISGNVADADQFWLGESDLAADGPPANAADRVAALLPEQSGTAPDEALPVLTRHLIALIFNAYAPDGTVDFPCFPPGELLRFLRAHKGGVAFVRTGGSSTTTNPPDEEATRLMRQHAAIVNRTDSARVTTKTVQRRGDDEPNDGGAAGVREPRHPSPDAPVTAAVVDPEEDQP